MTEDFFAGASGRSLPGGATKETLSLAVASSRSWRGVLRFYELTSSRAVRLLRQACDDWSIDYSHFRSRTWTDDELRQVLRQASTWNEVTAALGYAADSGSARATVSKHAVRLGLDRTALSKPKLTDKVAPQASTADLEHLRDAGTFLVAAACALAGYRISWPLEPAVYDLLIDRGDILRIQVKTTTWQLNGRWACKITHTSAGQQVWYTAQDIDYFGVVDGQL